MNKFIKAKLLTLIQANTVSLDRVPGTDVYRVKNNANELIMTVINSWDVGTYRIEIDDKNVYNSQWRENDNGGKKTPEQQDVMDIIDACSTKYNEQKKTRQADMPKGLSPNEMAVLDFLNTFSK